MIFEAYHGLSCSACERNWFLGTSGVCNVTSETCICPEGYSGKDDLVTTKTCHVNESLVRIFHYVLLAVLVVSLILLFFSYAVAWKRFKKNPRQTRRLSVRHISFLSINFAILYHLFFIVSVVAFISSPERRSFEDFKILLPFTSGGGLICCVIFYNLLFYSWYKSLPNASQYGAILDYPAFIVKYSSLISRFYLLNGLVWISMTVLTFFVLPLFDDEEDFMKLGAQVFLLFAPLGFIPYLILSFLSLISLESLYNTALKYADPPSVPIANTGKFPPKVTTAGRTNVFNPLARHSGAIVRALAAIKNFKRLAILTTVGCIGTSAATLYFGGLLQYFFLMGAVLVSSTNGTISILLTVRNTGGGMTIRA